MRCIAHSFVPPNARIFSFFPICPICPTRPTCPKCPSCPKLECVVINFAFDLHIGPHFTPGEEIKHSTMLHICQVRLRVRQVYAIGLSRVDDNRKTAARRPPFRLTKPGERYSFLRICNEVQVCDVVHETDHAARRTERVTLRIDRHDVRLACRQALDREVAE
jgi:hypothetical protein